MTESRSEQARSLDLPGVVLGTSGLLALTFGLIEANVRGWSDPLIVASLTAAILLLGAFLWWEARNPNAMMPLSYFRIPAFAAGNAVAFAVSLGMFSIFLFFTLYMQIVRGYSPMQAGVRFLPMTLMIVITAPNAGRVAQKIGSKAPMTYGLVLVGSGMLAMTQVTPETPYGVLAILFAVMGHGMGSTMAPMTAAVMGAVGAERAGLGSAMTNTSREVGGVLGVAALGTIAFAQVASAIGPLLAGSGLDPAQQEAIAEVARHGVLTPDALASIEIAPAQLGAVAAAYREAFMSGFHLAVAIGGLVLLTAALIANRFIPGRVATREARLADPEPVAAGH